MDCAEAILINITVYLFVGKIKDDFNTLDIQKILFCPNFVFISQNSLWNGKQSEQSDLGLHCLHITFCSNPWCTKSLDNYHTHKLCFDAKRT